MKSETPLKNKSNCIPISMWVLAARPRGYAKMKFRGGGHNYTVGETPSTVLKNFLRRSHEKLSATRCQLSGLCSILKFIGLLFKSFAN